MSGRKPKPAAAKKLEDNPGKRKLNKNEPVPAKGMLTCPGLVNASFMQDGRKLRNILLNGIKLREIPLH